MHRQGMNEKLVGIALRYLQEEIDCYENHKDDPDGLLECLAAIDELAYCIECEMAYDDFLSGLLGPPSGCGCIPDEVATP